MKHFYLIMTMLLMMAINAGAQTTDSIGVEVGGQRLADLLTAEQQKSLTKLTVTGKLQEADYAFIRSDALANIKEINLRNANIDTLPAHAFDKKEHSKITIILPKGLKHASEYALCLYGSTFIVTGKYPTVDKNVYFEDEENWNYKDNNLNIKASEDNPYCKNVGQQLLSTDGESLYFYNRNIELEKPDDNLFGGITLQDGIKTICSNVFENYYINPDGRRFQIVFPESLDSIGNRAFANHFALFYTGNGYGYKTLICFVSKALTPPKIGKDALLDIDHFDDVSYYFRIYVPDECVSKYKSADGWKDYAYYIYGITQIPTVTDGISSHQVQGDLSIQSDEAQYTIKSENEIGTIELFNAEGMLQRTINVKGTSAAIAKCLLSAPFSIVKVHEGNGKSETVRLLK
jgi:hypothetical protein